MKVNTSLYYKKFTFADFAIEKSGMKTIVGKYGSQDVQAGHRQRDHNALRDVRILALITTSKGIFNRFFPMMLEESKQPINRTAWVKHPRKRRSR